MKAIIDRDGCIQTRGVPINRVKTDQFIGSPHHIFIKSFTVFSYKSLSTK